MIRHCEEKDENVLTYLELKGLIFENEDYIVKIISILISFFFKFLLEIFRYLFRSLLILPFKET